jgi:hypothetical protein
MTHIIGIDPGPMVGVVLLKLPPIGATRPEPYHAEIAQITPNGLWALIAGWIEAYDINAIAGERFVVGHRASRVNAPGASQAARDVIGGLAVALPPEVRRIMRSAGEVKPWATDRRLDAAGLLDPTKGMRHARDAARHALYCACADFGARVPRSAVSA